MRRTLAEKLLSLAAGKEVRQGQTAQCRVDMALVHEAGAQMLDPLEEMGVRSVWDPAKVVAVIDHWVPASSERSAEMHQRVRELVKRYGITRFYDIGSHGVCHQLLAELGFVRPGMLVVGTDSHTTTAGAFGAFATGIGPSEMAAVFALGGLWLRVPETVKVNIGGRLPRGVSGMDLALAALARLRVDGALYRAVEYCGSAVSALGMGQRMTLANMAVEMGAKTGLVAPDSITTEYLHALPGGASAPVAEDLASGSDEGAAVAHEHSIDASELEPLVALPPSPDNIAPVSSLGEVRIDQAFVGSCTNGRIEDLREAAAMLKGRSVAKGVRFIVSPASQRIYSQALAEGLVKVFTDAGALFTPAGCSACFGGHIGALAPGEVCVSTSNRNFPGRMGSVRGSIYLASPATVAASALAGRIACAREVS